MFSLTNTIICIHVLKTYFRWNMGENRQNSLPITEKIKLVQINSIIADVFFKYIYIQYFLQKSKFNSKLCSYLL